MSDHMKLFDVLVQFVLVLLVLEGILEHCESLDLNLICANIPNAPTPICHDGEPRSANAMQSPYQQLI